MGWMSSRGHSLLTSVLDDVTAMQECWAYALIMWYKSLTQNLSLQVVVFVQSLSRVQLFCDPMDCSLPCGSVHGILQARILEWVAIPFSRGSSWPRDGIRVSSLAGDSLPLSHQRSPKFADYWCSIPRVLAKAYLTLTIAGKTVKAFTRSFIHWSFKMCKSNRWKLFMSRAPFKP